jgi:hypothetical protein
MNHGGWCCFCNKTGFLRLAVEAQACCQFRHVDLAQAKDSGERKKKMLERRSKGRLLHIVERKL